MIKLLNFIKLYPYIFLAFIFLLHAITLSNLVFFPFPEFFVLPYFTNQGLIPYKEVVDQHAPGLFFLPINAGTLGLYNAEVARVWLIVITCVVSFLIFITTRLILKNSLIGLLASLIFYFWHAFWGGWTLWIDSLIPLILVPAFYVSFKIAEKADNRLSILLGVIFGFGIALKQTTLPLAIFIPIFLAFSLKDYKIIFYFLIGFLPIPVLVVLYFLKLGVFWDVYYWAGIFNATVYPQLSRKGPEYPTAIQMIVAYSPILFFPFIKNRKTAVLLCLFTFWSLVPIVDRFDSNHFQPSLPFLSIGLALIIYQFYKVKRLIAYFLLYFAISSLYIYKDIKMHLRDEVIIYDDKMISLSQTVKEYATPGEEIFAFGVNPLLYYLSDTLPPGRYFVFQMPWYLSLLEDKSLESLAFNKPKLVVRDRSYNIDGESLAELAPKIDAYIDNNYVVIEKSGNFEILRRRD